MKLYELTDEYQRLYDCAADADGELSPQLDAAIWACEGAIADKLEGCCRVLRNLETEQEALRAESQRLAERARRCEAGQDRLKSYMLACLSAADIDRLDAGIFKVHLRQSPPSLKVDDEKLIPPAYWRTTPVLDKKAALADLKAGRTVPGVSVTQGVHLRIQ